VRSEKHVRDFNSSYGGNLFLHDVNLNGLKANRYEWNVLICSQGPSDRLQGTFYYILGEGGPGF
jgi:hypothetical protein